MEKEEGKKRKKRKKKMWVRAPDLCEQGDGSGLSFPIPFLSVPDKPYGFCGRKVPWKKKKGKKKEKRRRKKMWVRAPDLCEQGDGSGLSFPIPFLSVPDKPYGFCGRKVPWKKKKGEKKKKKKKRRKKMWVRAPDLCEQGDGSGLSFAIPFPPVPNKPYGFCGRKAPWKKKKKKKKRKKKKKDVGQRSGSV